MKATAWMSLETSAQLAYLAERQGRLKLEYLEDLMKGVIEEEYKKEKQSNDLSPAAHQNNSPPSGASLLCEERSRPTP